MLLLSMGMAGEVAVTHERKEERVRLRERLPASFFALGNDSLERTRFNGFKFVQNLHQEGDRLHLQVERLGTVPGVPRLQGCQAVVVTQKSLVDCPSDNRLQGRAVGFVWFRMQPTADQGDRNASALTQTDDAGSPLSLASMEAAEAVQTNGLELALCSAR